VIKMALTHPKLLLHSLVRKVCDRTVLQETPRIEQCTLVERKGGQLVLQTAGVNFPAAWALADEVDVNALQSNDISAVLQTFGVEAARELIVREINGIFKVYGISVDARHLGLLADYMTFEGGFRPLSRLGIAQNPAAFQRITFETSAHFLFDASLNGDVDDLASPSSRIVVGAPVRAGTGCFSLLQPLR
jgi:DNA-directed RNA polymerase I subunit RPA1